MNSHPYFNSLQGGDYHVFPDGRVLMSGSHTLQDSIRGFVGYYELIWFSNEGYLDTTRTHRQSDGTVWAFKELPNGQFVCSGYGTMLEGLPVDRIFRIHADGSPDTTFHTGVFWGEAKSFLTLPDGRFYACGFFRTTQLPGDTLHVARFLPDGTLDTTFTPPDIRDSGLNSIYGALGWTLFAIDPAHLLIGGTFVSVDGQPRSGICLVDTTGQLMPAFHAQGVGPVQDGQGIYTTVQCILPNADTSAIYISGAFVGYNDGIINDAQQRFVSRLLVEEVHVGVQEELAAPQPGPSMRLHPNPAGGTVTLALDQFIPDGELLVRDALGRTVHRQRIRELHTLVHLASLRTGVYVVELLSGGVPHGAQRLVVQR